MRVCAVTDVGRKRSVNQDCVFYSQESIGSFPNLFIVADGMGGHKAGDLASRLAVNTMVKRIKEIESGQYFEIFDKVISEVNAEIFRMGQSSPDLEGMGTTFVAAIRDGNALSVVNIGDSRLYVIGQEIRQITKDHSLVEEMITFGEINRAEARVHENKNIITRAIGAEENIVVDYFEVDLDPFDSVLMCSDGLSNMLEDDEIFLAVKREVETKDKVADLIEKANKNGGRDNVSVILIEPDK
ncbi:MAG: Stp1/IreP family PP2C-type Ser/Thr phosphatase [Clostridiales bacterium]|nr:Stp1/IreP family PP2C-type Ser/Thr phosphatase [Clostridiales bacterium]